MNGKSGQKQRLAKRGLRIADGSAGSFYAGVRSKVPATIGAREQVLFAHLATSSGFNPRQHFAAGVTA